MEDLIKRACASIIDADEDEAMRIIKEATDRQLDVMLLLRDGFAQGNNKVGNLFEAGKISLPELIFCTEVMRNVLYFIEENFEAVPVKSKGRVLIATVSGDVHEIGKGMVVSTMKSLGIDIIDIGREVPVETIIEKAEEYGATIIATSALLTSTLAEQRKLETTLRNMGIRDKYITMVGGAPCSARWAKRIGADYYTEDAVEAAKKAAEILNGRNKG